jgi:8-amino-7-oxononanoate synthase
LTSSLERRLQQAAGQRARAAGQRTRLALRPLHGMQVSDGHSSWVNFSSNDYLGLAAGAHISSALEHAAGGTGSDRPVAGSGASALISGYHPEHQALEQELADFLQRDAVLLCSSGFQANLAAVAALAGRGDSITMDRLCHASLIDAARVSAAGLRRYRHNDVDSAQQQLQPGQGHRLLVSDGVFSMDGDCAPLQQLAGLAQREGATLLVDDAHGIGVLGAGGGGLLQDCGLGQAEVPVLTGTLGKAFGISGAFVAGSRPLVEHLVNEARAYIYTTAPPPALAAAARAALRLVAAGQHLRDQLGERINQLREGAARRGLPLLPSHTPIQPLVVGSAERALELSARVRALGYLVVAIRPPTVPAGSARLRITLSAGHSAAQVEGLLDALQRSMDNL